MSAMKTVKMTNKEVVEHLRHNGFYGAADLIEKQDEKIEKQDRLLGLYRKRDELLTEAVRRAFLFIADKKHITVVDGLYECSKKIDADKIREQIKQQEESL